MNTIKYILILFDILLTISYIRSDGVCGDWDSFKDERCFRVYTDLGQHTYDSAQAICENNSATLATIHNADEQEFITKLVFITHKVVDEVWIGGHREGKVFQWIQEKADIGPYTNWLNGSPTNDTNEDCLQMVPKSKDMGKWDDENCTKKNLFVCQKLQKWTIDMIQQTLLNERKQLQSIIADMDSLKKANPIPIGFTYVQLPKEKAPQDIWPTFKWQEVSANYAGVFFRITGGSAAPVGQIQEESTPRLAMIEIADATGYKDKSDPIGKGGHAKIKAGSTGNPWFFQFDVSNDEVRPRNMAVRVWNRIA
ncbi:uncharacterized protein LOC128955441 [Oppia nitens]|uniref:uncharacterized protein LOC128955441 n=1 Tax=Oppia nitens TaxID=1686743 RepID=UPI0023DA44F3|nr:uncharacterized protein LOC128955441 [Oppia nitens]